jgi:beta-lactamase superfamily II metal-dependent hydrolase
MSPTAKRGKKAVRVEKSTSTKQTLRKSASGAQNRRKRPTAKVDTVNNSPKGKRTKTDSTMRVPSTLIPPPQGVVVRMYRIGHGDCFLLAFPGADDSKPVYVLIDCGYKPGSPAYINTTPKDITKNIREATGGHIDVAVITHEHQDHVNAITEANFKGITIGETWFAWTEDPDDDIANSLRRKFKDKLLGLLAARNRLSAAGDVTDVDMIDRLLAFELGGDAEHFDAHDATLLLAAGDARMSANKKSMALLKDRATNGSRYIRPQEKILKIPGVKDVRVFSLGPPRDPNLLKSLAPVGNEEFHFETSSRANFDAFFGAAAMSTVDAVNLTPFAGRYWMAWDVALDENNPTSFFIDNYGPSSTPAPPSDDSEVGPSEEWRRINNDWLYSAGQLALAMNDQTNNSSLVLAFELGKAGKVLLFAADAQRGNWVSWSNKDWKDGSETINARDLLNRTVLYKVGHHGSHNATLNGLATDDYPCLGWMGIGDHASEFTAMITAVRAWAETQDGWDHPLKAIKDALIKKASGRVFQTDTDFEAMNAAAGSSERDWKSFQRRTSAENPLYFDYTVEF